MEDAFTFMFLKNKENKVMMIANGIILYLLHFHPVEYLTFFDPCVVIEKEEWIWDEENSIIVNSLSKSIDGLESANCDYTFADAECN